MKKNSKWKNYHNLHEKVKLLIVLMYNNWLDKLKDYVPLFIQIIYADEIHIVFANE